MNFYKMLEAYLWPLIKQLYSWKEPYIPAPGSEQVRLEMLIFTKYLANLFNAQYWWSRLTQLIN